MRRLLLLLSASLALTAGAAPQPLSLKEISLMLRSGYSSESVLQEVETRRVIDALDPAMKKSLMESGATPHRISALENGGFQLDETAAASARREAAERAAQQTEQTTTIYRDAIAVLQERRTHATNPATAPAGAPLMAALQDKLVVCRDGVIRSLDRAVSENKRLIAFYFSAHWCAPCRKFTPQLVDYCNRVRPQHPEFELIFVSFDRSRFNWETYMRDAAMPWPALDVDQLSQFDGLKRADARFSIAQEVASPRSSGRGNVRAVGGLAHRSGKCPRRPDRDPKRRTQKRNRCNRPCCTRPGWLNRCRPMGASTPGGGRSFHEQHSDRKMIERVIAAARVPAIREVQEEFATCAARMLEIPLS